MPIRTIQDKLMKEIYDLNRPFEASELNIRMPYRFSKPLIYSLVNRKLIKIKVNGRGRYLKSVFKITQRGKDYVENDFKIKKTYFQIKRDFQR